MIVEGRSYVSEGKSHVIDFKVNGLELGTHQSQVNLDRSQSVTITARVAAHLPEVQDAIGAIIAARPQNQPPYWDVERARIGKTRRVAVELVVNGEPVARTEVAADGAGQRSASSTVSIARAGWHCGSCSIAHESHFHADWRPTHSSLQRERRVVPQGR